MSNIIETIRKQLRQNSDEKTKETGMRFFKEKIKLYGVKTPTVIKMSKEMFKSIKDKNKKEIYKLCEELWKSGYMEESFIACNWSYALHSSYEPEDFKIFERWINKYVSNWASCDTFCNHTIGALLEIYPEYITKLKKWAKSKNRWVRRASAVSLIIPAKKGLFLKDKIGRAHV